MSALVVGGGPGLWAWFAAGRGEVGGPAVLRDSLVGCRHVWLDHRHDLPGTAGDAQPDDRAVSISRHSVRTAASESERTVVPFLRNFNWFTRGEPLINIYEGARGH